jgi:hypothetical protein
MANILFISCYKATELIEKKINTPSLSLKEQVQLRLHQAICGVCKHYENHSKMIEKWLKKRESQENNLPDISEEEIEKLKEKILERRKKL